MTRHFDDFRVGETFTSPGITLSEAAILEFALLYDPQPFHLDAEAARASHYGGLIASGFHTLAVAFRAFYQANVINACSLGSPGIDELRWLKPVRPGDTLRTVAEVKELRPSGSKPDRGVCRMGFTCLNQKDVAVMTFTATILLARKGA